MRIVTVAALFSLPIVAAATTQTLAVSYGSSANGGGSYGYNRGVATDYRLKKHHHAKKLQNSVKPQATGGNPGGAPAAGGQAAGGGAAKQPMGRP